MQLPITPPTETATVSARRVLILSPHYDDEVFGCGGLLAQLAESEAEIRVLYLTDSSGGVEITDDREAYAAQRRIEAQRGLDVLGIGQLETLAIPDGALADHLEEAARAVGRVIQEHQPDLMLSVSPCEVTSDHRAAFTTLYRSLSSLRGGGDLERIMAGCQILLFEVNHPGYPDLLVDVSLHLDLLRMAIEAHQSQLELHNYREAALGMRHFRALSLPADVQAAEGYREVTLADFTTHSHDGLVRRLGGVIPRAETHDGPLVSVIVRTKDRPELLAEALDSVAASTYRRVEVVLVNDGGEAPSIPAGFPLSILPVEMGSNQGRAAAANAGVAASTGDYISFLDDDDLMEPEHLETLVNLVSASDVRVAYTDAAVGIYELDAESGWSEADRRLPYSRDFDPELLLLDNYIPFNTLIIERSLFAAAGPFDTSLDFFEDWDFLIRLAAVTPFYHLPQVTAEYRHFRGADHHILGERPRERGDFIRQKAAVIERHADRLGSGLLARVVDRLRAETVTEHEATAASRDELAELRRAHAETTGAYHRLNGEVESLRGERERLLAESEIQGAELTRLADGRREQHRQIGELETEISRLGDEEAKLRSTIADQEGHLGKLYAEIERLNEIISSMENTTAWTWHKRMERLKGKP